MRCTHTRFSALRRRHHCRRCGFVVCGACSRARALLPRLAPRPQRVCGFCYRQLAAQRRPGEGDGQEAGGPPGAAEQAEAEAEQAEEAEAGSGGASSGASSGDEDSEEDKEAGGGEGDWPGPARFYHSGVSWASAPS